MKLPWIIAVILAIAFIAACLFVRTPPHVRSHWIHTDLISTAYAHEHRPNETEAEAKVTEFYRNWHRPKGNFAGLTHRQAYCCYAEGANQDCFPVLKQRMAADGTIEVMPDLEGTEYESVKLRYEGKWFKLNTQVEEDKQPDPITSPDGRSHVCISGANVVVCYVPGWGG